MAIKNDFVVKHGLTVTNTATINQDLIVAGSIKKNGVDVGYGYTGSQGNIGYTGSQGIQGVTGYTGSQGIQGNIGYTGSRGNIGYTGSQGAQGIAGYTGSQGVIGYTGSKGDSGLGFTIAKTYASVAALTADTNPTGIIAGQFALIETGNVEDPENSRLYLWNGSAYTYVSDLSGAQGITGPQGVIGYTGSQGAQGVTGYTGSQGAQGVTGYTGSAGPSNVLNATAASTSSVQYIVGVPVTGSNQTPNASTTVPVVFQPSTGNVGIGANPTVPLEVRKSAAGSNVIQRVGISGQTKNPYLESKFDETNGLVTLNASGASTPAFIFEIAQSEKVRIDTAGKVGIGTNAPAAVLDVNGASASNIVAVAASDVNCSLGNYFTKTINGATTFTFSNVPASRAFSFVLAVTHTSGAITWPASVSWPNSTAPTLTTGKTHLFVFVTSDGGSTWRGNSSVNY